MKYLCAIRHGSYNSDTGYLNERGREEVTSLSERLMYALRVTTATVVSSPTNRTLQTARIIADRFIACSVETHRFLSDEDRSARGDIWRLHRLIKMYEKLGTESLILVTHEPQATQLPVFFGEEVLGLAMKEPRVDMATGWIINCHKKTFSRI